MGDSECGPSLKDKFGKFGTGDAANDDLVLACARALGHADGERDQEFVEDGKDGDGEGGFVPSPVSWLTSVSD